MPENFDVANGAAFTDILEISVDANAFRQGLEQLRTAYNDFVSSLGSGVSGSDIINTGSMAALKTDLQGLLTSLGTIKKEFSETFADVTGGIVESLNQISESVGATKGKRSMVSSLVGDDDEAAAAKKRIVDIDGVQTEVSEKEFLRMERIARQQASVQDQMAASAEKEANAEQVARERVGRLHAQVLEKQAADAERTALKEQAARERVGRLHAQVLEKQALDAERAAEKEAAATERLARMQEKAYFEMQSVFQKRAEAQEKAAQKQIEIQDRVARKEAEANESGGFGAWAASIGTSFIKLTQFMVILEAVQLLIQAIELPFKIVAGFLKDGWEYASKLQQTVADLQGVLASTVKFTKDGFAENFRLAGEAAEFVVKRLQNIAIAINLPVQNLVSAFKAVADSGGAAFVKDLEQMVKLSEFFAIAVKATGKDFQVQRTIISEIPGLLNGSIAANSKILETLGLTKDAWESIRKSGLDHKDLVERLIPVLQPFLTVAQQADLRFEAVKNKLELIRDRLSAIAIEPVFKLVIQWASDLATWLEKNQQLLTDLFKSAGQLLEEFTNLVISGSKALAQMFGVISSNPNSLLLALESTVFRLREIVSLTQFATDVWTAYTNKRDNNREGLLTDKQIEAEFNSDMARARSQFEERQRLITIDHEDFVDAANRGSGTDQESGNKTILGGRVPNPNNDKTALDQLKRDFKAQIEAIKQGYKEIEDAATKAKDKGTITFEQYIHSIQAAKIAEKSELDEALSKFDVAANASGAPAKSIKQAKDNAAQTILKDKGQLNAQIRELDDSLIKYENKLQEEALEHARKLSIQKLKDEKELAQQTGATRTQIAQFDIAIQERAYQDQKAILDQEEKDAGVNEKKLQDIANRRALLELQNSTAIASNKKKLSKAILDDLIASDRAQSAIAHQQYNDEVIQQQALERTHNSVKQLAEGKLKLANANLALANSDLRLAEHELAVALAQGADKKTVDDLRAAIEKLRAERDKAAQGVVKAKTDADGDQARLNLFQQIFGKGVQDLSDVFSKGFADGTAGLLNAFTFFKQTIGGLINAFKQGFQQGGVLGGIGGLATQIGGQISSIFPVAGTIISGAGQVLSFIGGLFKRAAQKIAEQIQKAFDETIKNFRNGSINLTQAINQLEQERADAIARLSGKKGGKDELNKLLPEIDDQLASLRAQQKQTIDDFDHALQSLRLQSDVLSKVYDNWTAINKQVKDYLDAGGSIAKANEFLSLSLAKLRKQTQDDLRSGEETAVSDALSLNDLLEQRLKLIQDIAKNEFAAATADSLERNQAGAIVRGTALSQLKAEDKKQLDEINQQIDLQNQKVEKERQVFNIATDINELHKQDAQLQLDALDEQIAQWKDMKLVIDNIINDNGVFKLSSLLLALFGLTPPSSNGAGSGGLGGLGLLGGGDGSIDLDGVIRGIAGGRGGGILGAMAFGTGGVINGGIGPGTSSPIVQIDNITVTATGDANVIGGQIVDSLTSEIERRVKQSRGAFFRF